MARVSPQGLSDEEAVELYWKAPPKTALEHVLSTRDVPSSTDDGVVPWAAAAARAGSSASEDISVLENVSNQVRMLFFTAITNPTFPAASSSASPSPTLADVLPSVINDISVSNTTGTSRNVEDYKNAVLSILDTDSDWRDLGNDALLVTTTLRAIARSARVAQNASLSPPPSRSPRVYTWMSLAGLAVLLTAAIALIVLVFRAGVTDSVDPPDRDLYVRLVGLLTESGIDALSTGLADDPLRAELIITFEPDPHLPTAPTSLSIIVARSSFWHSVLSFKPMLSFARAVSFGLFAPDTPSIALPLEATFRAAFAELMPPTPSVSFATPSLTLPASDTASTHAIPLVLSAPQHFSIATNITVLSPTNITAHVIDDATFRPNTTRANASLRFSSLSSSSASSISIHLSNVTAGASIGSPSTLHINIAPANETTKSSPHPPNVFTRAHCIALAFALDGAGRASDIPSALSAIAFPSQSATCPLLYIGSNAHFDTLAPDRVTDLARGVVVLMVVVSSILCPAYATTFWDSTLAKLSTGSVPLRSSLGTHNVAVHELRLFPLWALFFGVLFSSGSLGEPHWTSIVVWYLWLGFGATLAAQSTSLVFPGQRTNVFVSLAAVIGVLGAVDIAWAAADFGSGLAMLRGMTALALVFLVVIVMLPEFGREPTNSEWLWWEPNQDGLASSAYRRLSVGVAVGLPFGLALPWWALAVWADPTGGAWVLGTSAALAGVAGLTLKQMDAVFASRHAALASALADVLIKRLDLAKADIDRATLVRALDVSKTQQDRPRERAEWVTRLRYTVAAVVANSGMPDMSETHLVVNANGFLSWMACRDGHVLCATFLGDSGAITLRDHARLPEVGVAGAAGDEGSWMAMYETARAVAAREQLGLCIPPVLGGLAASVALLAAAALHDGSGLASLEGIEVPTLVVAMGGVFVPLLLGGGGDASDTGDSDDSNADGTSPESTPDSQAADLDAMERRRFLVQGLVHALRVLWEYGVQNDTLEQDLEIWTKKVFAGNNDVVADLIEDGRVRNCSSRLWTPGEGQMDVDGFYRRLLRASDPSSRNVINAVLTPNGGIWTHLGKVPKSKTVDQANEWLCEMRVLLAEVEQSLSSPPVTST